MIALDFGLLFTLTAGLETLPQSNAAFKVVPSIATKSLLAKHQSIFKFIDGKGHILASDILASFTKTQMGSLEILELNEVRKKITAYFSIFLNDRAISQSIDVSFKPANLLALQELPASLKPVFVIQLDDNSSDENLVDASNIIGIAPPFLTFEKSQITAIHYTQNNKLLQPSIEDEARVQYNLTNIPEGIYEVIFSPTKKKKIYVNSTLYTKPPLAIVAIELKPATPPDSFMVKEYELKFKKKPIAAN